MGDFMRRLDLSARRFVVPILTLAVGITVGVLAHSSEGGTSSGGDDVFHEICFERFAEAPLIQIRPIFQSNEWAASDVSGNRYLVQRDSSDATKRVYRGQKFELTVDLENGLNSRENYFVAKVTAPTIHGGKPTWLACTFSENP